MTLVLATIAALLAGSPLAHSQPHEAHDVRPAAEDTGPHSADATIQRALQQALPSIVRVWFGEGDMLTGTIVSDDGLVLTCAHLPVPVGGPVEIGLQDGRRVPAKVLSKLPKEGQSNIGRDVALVQISESGPWPRAWVAVTAPAGLDAPVLAAGFPDTMLYGTNRATDPLYVRLGHPILSPYESNPAALVTSIFGTGGDSGGPLLDLAGRVIGVVHGGDASGSHVSYTRIEVLRRNWNSLAPGRSPPPVPTADQPAPLAVAEIEKAAAPIRDAVVEVNSEARPIGLGCVVGDGLILTKASELGTNLTVSLANNYVGIVEVAATDPERDLALLRLQYAPELTSGITPVTWDNVEAVRAGQLVVLATPDHLSPRVGVACFEARAVPRIQGAIPCEFEQGEGGVRVVRVSEEFRAFRLRKPALPLRPGDTIVSVEGQAVSDMAGFGKLVFDTERIGSHPSVSGEPIRIGFRRGDATLERSVVLEFAATPSGQLVRPVSNRYSSFPSAIATDLDVRPEHCGGPVLDSQGRVVGLLIARAPFIESLVLPAGEIADSLRVMLEAASK